MVAVGSLGKIWLQLQEDADEGEMRDAFRTFFCAEWTEVIDVAEKSFAYNAANDAYFAVCDLHPLEHLTLEQLLEEKGMGTPLNIIVS